MTHRAGRTVIAVAVTALTLAPFARAQNESPNLPPLPNLRPLPSLRSLPNLPPLQRQWQVESAPPIQQAAPIQQPPTVVGPSIPAPDATRHDAVTTAIPPPDAQPPPTVAPGWPNVWLPASTARLQALDKVNAQATTLTIKVGQSATLGSLTVTVKACMTRPADQPADAAAYLDVTDSHPDQPTFDGWILQDEPAVSMMQHPIYDLRVAGCA